MVFSDCSGDATFGPAVQGCRDDFDFTLKFEKIFLSLIPASIFVVVSISRSLCLIRKPTLVQGRILQSIKAGTIAIYAALQLPLVVLGCTDAGRLTAFFVSSAVLNLVAAVFMLTLSFLEHSRTPRPSILLNAYLFLTLLFDITQCRSLWLAAVNPADEAFACVFTVSCALKVVLIVMESQQKSKWLQWNMKDHSPEEISGLYSLGAFFWLNKLFLKGYRKLLTLDDLFPLDQTMVSEALGKKLEVYLEVNPTHEQKFGLTKGMAKVLAVPLLLPVVPRIALLAFSFCQPFLINSLLLYLESPESERSANWGYGLIGATTIIYSGIAVSSAFYNYYRERFLWMARGALASVIYKKTTQSKISGTDGSAALTLMSTDIERIRWGFMGLHDFWASAVQIGLASWLLYRELGIAFIGPIIVILLCTICVTFLSRFSGKTQKAWMEQIQKRVGLTSNMIANMKHLKISGLTEPVETLVQKLRVNEISAGNRWRITMVIAAVASFTPSMIGPVVAFAFSAQTLNVTRTFTSMSFLTLLTAPLASILQLVPLLLAALTCLQRIQAFLEKEPRSDFRESTLVRLSEKSDNVAAGEETSAVMRISNGNFGWGAGKTSLKNLEFNIPPYSLTMVVGPIASGKSTLCKVLLGETPVYSGHITMALASRRVGYCDQVPFLSNSTVRENIVGYSSFNSARYNEVVEATMLLPDFAVLRHGDCTKVGSNGITLSGGQKQRVSMARALYSSSDFLIFDDILSGLDADTEEQVFQRVFGPDGLVRRRKSTAILCTHSVRHLPAADHIIALGPEGCLVEQGTFEDLVSNENYVHSLGVKAADKHDGDVKPCSSVDGLKTEELGATPLTRRHTLVSVASSHVDERNRQIGDSTVYRHYAKSMKLSALILFILADMATGFLSYLPQIWLNYWSADVMSPQRAHSEAFWVGVYALLRVLGLVFQGLACVIILITIISQSGTTLHHQTLHTVISAPLRFFTKTDAGIVTNLFSQDMTLIDTELPLALLNVMINIFACIGMAAVVATSSPYIAISYPFLIAILWVIQNFYLRTSRQLRLLDLEAKSPLYTHFTDTITGLATLRAFGWVEHSVDFNNRLLDNSQRPAYLLAMIQRWLTFVLYLVVAAMAILVVVLTTQVRLITGTGFTGASLVTLMSFGDIVSQLIMMYTQLETSIGAVSRLKSFSEKVLPESLSGEDIEPLESWPPRGAIEISGVSASYASPDEDRHKAGVDSVDLTLKNLNISITPGEKVAICGRSGSGKSSTILLLLRLIDPIPGCRENIAIDGVRLNRVNRSTLRQRIIAVSQDPVFLPDGTSFKENLDPFGTSTEDECRDVLETVDLWRFLKEQGGLDIGFSADTLSQGQKQLFSLARAILRRRIRSREAHTHFLISGKNNEADISVSTIQNGGSKSGSCAGGLLLLDEVSSSVDKDTDRAIRAIIRHEFADYTIVMVSHRLDMVLEFDKVLIMDKGSIIESGKPRELINQEGSSFKNLWVVGRHHM